jgi:iron complex transport system substrate-binding protein
MLAVCGADNVYADLDLESARVPMEDAIAREPDVLVACWCGARKLPTRDRILARAGWQDTPAVRGGRAFVLKEDLFGRPGPRLADGVEQLANLLEL